MPFTHPHRETPRILVTGGAGYLGWHLVRRFEREEASILATIHTTEIEFERAKVRRVDLEYADSVMSMIREFRPTTLVHTAAMTQTGDCEKNPEAAARANVAATRNLVEAATALGERSPEGAPLPHLIFTSTDLVFDGESAPYDESAATMPIMEYGRSKEAAEAVVRGYGGPWTILRPALIYGPPTPIRSSFIEWIVRPLREGKEVALFTDEWRTPVWVDDLAEAIARLARKPAPGVYHCGGAQRLTRRDMGDLLARRYGLPATGLKSLRRGEVKLPCPRPKDVSLVSARIAAAVGFRPIGFAEGIQRMPVD